MKSSRVSPFVGRTSGHEVPVSGGGPLQGETESEESKAMMERQKEVRRWWPWSGWMVIGCPLLLASAATMGQHLDNDEVCRCGGTQFPSARTLVTKFTYKAVVPEIPKDTKVVELWLPIPSDSEWQTVRDLQVSSPTPYSITQEQKLRNRMVYVRDEGLGKKDGVLEVSVSFVVERKEVRVLGNDGQVVKTYSCSPNCNCEHCRKSKELVELGLRPERLVPVGGRFLSIAQEVTQGKAAKLDKMGTQQSTKGVDKGGDA